ncbi:probable U3 small nucleolar RNA-associated protein 11 isoform X3 [Juglans microcarpa x Juglans regia]|uniref:probable U3 small nucleolar RNA-associated protein 11 isoform X3 n=1 Tax=Juglans microcarpa x Juglans regia TaxID=2249226 RepID=UPI001B7ED3D4|nr:probable U3 small nucleolar RNA-associated protein 11 isoform X3 [Juglans microcarpa x Juglans regia]
MSSLRNAISRRAHKERSQPHSRRKFGLLEKHKDYVERAQVFHKKEQTLQKLREKAAFRNPDEFYFRMMKAKTADGVHKLENETNKYNAEELMLMKTQDMGYILQKLQSQKKKLEKLTAVLHSLDSQPSNRHVYYAEDSKTAVSYRELEARRNRVSQLEKLYMDMALQKELQKKGRKRKLREDELAGPTSKPVYKWRSERKR